MKITIDLDDFWMDEDSKNFTEEFKNFVKSKTMSGIWALLKEKAQEQLMKEIKETVQAELKPRITEAIAGLIKNGKTASYRNSHEEVTLEEYVRECFQVNSNWSNFEKTIQNITTSFAKELRERYDLNFASQVVVRLGEQGFLKEDISKLLTEGK